MRVRPWGAWDWLCLLLCLAPLALAACGPLGRSVWAADVVNLFRPYAVVGALGVLLVCLSTRRLAVIGLAGLALVANLLLLAAPAMAGDAMAKADEGEGGTVLKVITFNCLGSNTNSNAAVAWMRSARPDILVLEEVPDGWRPALAELGDVLPGRASALEDTPGDTDVMSRAPMLQAEVYRPSPDLRTLVHAVVRLPDGRRLQVFGIHPNTLQSREEWGDRNAALELTGQWIAQTRGRDPAVAAGDWNTPPWSPYFTRFLRLAGLKAADPLVWPPMTRVLAHPLGLRLGSSIDHVAGSSAFSVLRCETGPQLGSDHAPQVCWIRLGQGG